MKKETIGQNAGLIWHALQEGEKNVKAVKRVTKLRERELNMALGWLAREGKIILKEVENELFVSLA
ncbi:MAG: winged helix-turn-helix domain-containing protein [Paludibacter sp.]|jgi:hypothetical protein|nr:winged helix-turn-helix domain-containing protein [Bacteroidales bacterium]HOG05594.1 winged helix-turn-helix domain-containing protein [Paludibacter sp.]